jgi:CDGSH-type Zn-finger protein
MSEGRRKHAGRIVVSRDGPYLVEGDVPVAREIIVRDAHDIPVSWKKGMELGSGDCALCRCGGSGKKPYCDGTHARINFQGKETAGHETYAECAERIEGPGIDLDDAEELCARLQFCHRAGGVWNVVELEGEASCKIVREISHNCSSGRLTAVEKDGTPSEPVLEKGIGVVEDPKRGMSGPLWISGGIPVIAADGIPYEVRNRVTLCRCGHSQNKPFCDGSHVDIRFNDGSAKQKD